MMKKILSIYLCIIISFSMAACSEKKPQVSMETEQSDNDTPEPLLGPDSTDEDLLELLAGEIHVVTDEDYIEMINDFKEHTDQYAGKIYQIEGTYTMEGDVPYLTGPLLTATAKARAVCL